ncbi:MAG: hypothetical protein ABW139_15160 [Candidatus Thiodiazotropha sp. DIVDIV]
MNNTKPEEWTGKTISKATIGIVLRVLGYVVWFITYVGFMYSAGYAVGLEHLVGLIALFVGAIALLLPKRVLGEEKWFYTIYAFYGLSILYIFLA